MTTIFPSSERMTGISQTLRAALDYAAHGDPVFPIWPAEGNRCGCADDCGSPGKHPIGSCVPNGLKNATTDEATLTRWFTHYPQANLAVRTGITCTVLDVDRAAGGRETLDRLERRHGDLPEAPTVLTGGGGAHYYFAAVPGLGNSSGKIGPGLDIRGEGGYVLVPPSNHVSGGLYRENLMAPIYGFPRPPMPEWLVALAQGSSSHRNGHPTRTWPPNWAELLAGTSEGERHAGATQIAGHYLRMKLPVPEVEQILLNYARACAPPFPDSEARRIVRDLAAKDSLKAGLSSEDPPPYIESLTAFLGVTDQAQSAISPERIASRLAEAQQTAIELGCEPTAFGSNPPPSLGVGLGTFLAQTFEAQSPLIEGLLTADGNGWIAGEEKLGKTYYALEEALALSLGHPVAGRFRVPSRQRVLFIEEEDPPRRAHVRLHALLRGHGFDPTDYAIQAELDGWFQIGVWSGFTLDDDTWLRRLDTTCATFRPAVVYLDVLRKMTRRDLNKAVEAGGVLATLDTIRRDRGVIFRILHHYRKSQGFRSGRGSQEIGGSFVLGAWAESSLFFEPVGRKQGTCRIDVQVKDGPPIPSFTLGFYAEGPAHAPTLVRLTAEDQAEDVSADDILLQAVASGPKTPPASGRSGVTVSALAVLLKRSEKTIRRGLKRLVDAELVQVVGKAAKGTDLYAVAD